MDRKFTPKGIFILVFILVWAGQLILSEKVLAQCSASTPKYNVNLDGQPSGSWTSPATNRDGLCCNVTGSENCVQFNVVLDSRSGGLQFDIINGPVPSGSMFYQIDCGPSVPVGSPICVTGSGVHKLTLCMPGNASNTFRITSIAAFKPMPDVSVTQGCFSKLLAPVAFNEPTVTWRDITGGGAYNKYLSCLSGCSAPTITPDNNTPPFVDYVVCGTSNASLCATLPYCDTIRVFFYPPPQISIGPQPAIICPSGGGVELTGTVTGGSGNFQYIWTNSSGTVVGNSQKYTATAVGTYNLEIRNENYPNCNKFSQSVTVVSNLTVNAGTDQTVCSLNPVQLAGTVTAATGGIWSGGAGTFSSNNTALDAIYTPTPNEIQAGFVKLTLTSTGNGSCTPVKDEVQINLYTITVNITGPASICPGTSATLVAQVSGAAGTPTFAWDTGETTATIANKVAGTYIVTIRDGNSCEVKRSFTITQQTGPTDLAATIKPTTCGNSNGELAVTGVTGGAAPYTYSLNGGTFDGKTLFTALDFVNHTITVKDANGCTFTKQFSINNIDGPSAVAASASPASCTNNGTIVAGTVTGGTAPYTYSINGTTFQSGTNFNGLAAGSYTLTVKDANKCLKTAVVAVGTNVPTGFSSSTVSSTCGGNNGSLTITAISGGAAPYTYSKDGINYQTSNTFPNLLPASYTITVRDANGCNFSGPVQVANIGGATDFAVTIQSPTCANSNGGITVSAVTGGDAPFTYSKDGVNYSSSNIFNGLPAGDFQLYVKDGNGCVYSEEVLLDDIPGPSFTVTAQASTCSGNNGQIMVGTVTGGTAPYTYSKDGVNYQTTSTFSQLSSGTYTISVRDINGCFAARAIVVNDFAGPVDFTVSATATTCGSSNGTFSVTSVSGGTAPYTYAINGGGYQSGATFGTLAAGAYTISIKDAYGCTFSKPASINNIAGPTDFSATTKSSTCGGTNGELTLTGVTGGTTPYTYSKDGSNYQASATFTALGAGQYTMVVKDANGCTYSKNISVTDISGPTAVATTTTPATCADNDGGLTAGTVTGGTAPYTYSVDGSGFQTSTTFTGLVSGNITLTIKDANGCLFSQVVTFGKNIPTSFASSTVSATCGRSDGSLTINGVTGGTAPYTYSLNGSTFQATSTFTSLLPAIYSVTVKDANGCTFTGQVTINNIPGPTDLTASLKASTCNNSNGEITVNGVSGGTEPYMYSKDGLTYQASSTFSGLPAGAYLIFLKDANNCIYSEEILLNNIAAPVFTVQATSATCGNSNGMVVVNSVSGGVAPYTYSIDGVTFLSGTSFQNLAAGYYSIRVKDLNGCFTAQSVEVKNIAGPTNFTVSVKSSVCGSANGELTAGQEIGGTSPYSYSLDGSNYQGTGTFTALMAGEYTVTVRDANGCTFSEKATINNIAGPTDFAASTKPSTCGSSDGELTLGTVTGGTAPYTYSRNGTDFQVSALFTNLAAGSYTMVVKDANGCIFSKPVAVNDLSGVTALATTTTPSACTANTGTISINGTTGGVAPYSYSLDGINFQSSVSFTGLAPVTHIVYVKDANACKSNFSVTIQTNGPQATIVSTVSSTCGNNNGELTVTGVTGGVSPYSYSKDGATYQASATFQGLPAGAHTITIKDANGCTYTKPVTINNISGPADLTATTKAPACKDSNGEITVSVVAGGSAPYTYSKDGVAFQVSATFVSLPSGDYQILVKDANGCIYSEKILLNDILAPVFNLQVQPATCGNSNGEIRMSGVSGGVGPYTFSLDNITYQASASFSNLKAGTYTISVKDANGCLTSKSVTLINIPGPSDFTATTASSSCGNSNGGVTITDVTGGTAPYTYSYDGTNFQASNILGSLAAGKYTVTVKDANGCTFSEKATINNIAGPTDLTATTKSATCGGSDGELTVTVVTGGTAPYTYSKDGSNYQTSATFTALGARQYTLVVKDATGCIFSKNISLTNINGPSAVAAASVPATCADNDGSLTAGTVTGGTSPYTYSVNGTTYQAGTSFIGLASGNYVLWAKDANGCLVTRVVTVEKDVPTSFTSSTVPATCGRRDGSLTINAVIGGTAPYTYSLNGSAFQVSTSFASLLPATYSVTVKDANGCTYTGQVQVNNTGGATDLTASLKMPACGNSNGEITISAVTGGTAPFSYSLDGSAFQTHDKFTALPAGEYLVGIKDASGCVFEKKVLLNNIAGPLFTATSQSATCGNSNGQIIVGTVSGGTVPYSFSKDGITFQASTSFTNLAAGDYTIRVKDANGCLTAKSVSVDDKEGPKDFAATFVSPTCGERNGAITFTSVMGGTAPFMYSVNGSSFQPGKEFTSLASGSLNVTVQDANGCSFTKQIILNNSNGPSAIVTTATPATCGAKDGTITIGSITGGTAPYQYSLDGTTYQSEPIFSGLAPASYTIYVKDAIGCRNSFVAEVTTNGPQSAQITTGAAACGQGNGAITIQSVAGGTGALTYSLNGGNFQSSTTFTGLKAGIYTILIKDAEGCTLTLTKNLDNTGGAEAFTVTATDASCGKNNGRIVISNIIGGQSPYTYSINGSTYQSSADFTDLAVGTYQVSVKDAAGCVDIKPVAIGNSAPITKVDFSVIPGGCSQANGQIHIENVTGGTEPFTYSLDGINFAGAQSLAGNSGVAPGNYTLTVKDARNCILAVPVKVGLVTSKLAFVNDVSCQAGNNGSIAVTTTGKIERVAYSIDNGVTFQTDSVFTNLTKGIYTIIARFSQTCSVTVAGIEVKESGALQPVVIPTAKVIGMQNNGSAAISEMKGGKRPYSYQINNGNFTADTVFNNLAAGNHTLQVKDKNGCTTTVTFQIENVTEVEIPDGFTPNGDGLNDTWVLANIHVLYPACKVAVYNRWGNEVFRSLGYKTPWDGKHKGQKLPDGTYYCIIEFDNTKPPIRKAVTIMR